MMTTYELLYQSYPLLMKGFCMTLLFWLASATVAMCIGLIWGLLQTQRLWITGVSEVCTFGAIIVRGTPLYIQLLIAYFVIPELLAGEFSAEVIAIFSLGMCSAAYVSAIVKGGFDNVPRGQWEAASVLGYSLRQTIQYIITPQVIPMVVPALCGEMDQVLKSTSLLSTIGIFELARAGRNIAEREMAPLQIYLAVACIYVLVSLLFNGITMALARNQKGLS